MTDIAPLHRLWRSLPAGPRRAALSRATAWLAPRPGPRASAARNGIAVGGEIGRASGLGEGARLMLGGLRSLGIEAWQLECDLLRGRIIEMPPPGVPLVLHVNAPSLPATLLRLPRALPRGRRMVGYWAWELETTPPAWARGAPFVHDIWAPSRFTAAALEHLAPGRVRVVPHPVATCPPAPSGLSRADFGWPEGAVTVLVSFSLASSFERKNPLAAIAAFRAAFGTKPDRLLVLKVVHAHHAPRDLARLRSACAGADNIRFETRTMSRADSHAMTACADIVLSLHRSEGFGLVPAEALLLGRPVIATDYSGTTDFLAAPWAIPVPYRLVPAIDPRGVFEAPGARWAEADTDAAAAALRQLANDPDVRARLGTAGRAAARARLGTAALAEAVRSLGGPA